jgi:hypothetical protein
MHIKYGKNKSIIERESSIFAKITKLEKTIKHNYIGKYTRFTEGAFKGRWGKIDSIVCFDCRHGIIVTITPVSIKKGQVGKLMYDSEESLKGRVFSELEVFADTISDYMIIDYKKP